MLVQALTKPGKRICEYFTGRAAPVCLALLLLALSTPTDAATSYAYSTFAGAEHANVDGAGSNARFDAPRGVAVDRLGNVYVTDQANYTVRKITPNGVVTTLAGTPGVSGNTNGTGSAARFRVLTGLTIDPTNNLYVLSGNAVRKITPMGVVTTIAGRDDESGYVNGSLSIARLQAPESIVIDTFGIFYVLEPGPGRIRIITPDGFVGTYAGEFFQGYDLDGPLATATFTRPTGLAIDANDNLYVSSAFKIRKITTAGQVSTLAGGDAGYRDGTGAQAQFRDPQALTATSDGRVFVADSYNSVIRQISPAGVVTTFAGAHQTAGYTDGNPADARFAFLGGIAAHPTNGTLYVTDNTADTIRAISPSGTVSTLAGAPGRHRDGISANALFQGPQSFARDALGNTYVADRANHTIRKISATGIVTTIAGSPGRAGSADGSGNAARFNSPLGIAIGSGGVLLVTDFGNRTIRKVGVDGAVTTFAGTAGQSGSADGTGGNATFAGPERIAVDAQGNSFVTDSGNRTIRRITAAGAVTTIAGATGVAGTADGIGAAARFNNPRGIAVRADGSLIVVDNGAMTLRTIGLDGLVQTLAGAPGQEVSVDGTGTSARFSYPESVAVDSSGNMYVTELISGRLRKVTPSGVVTTEFTFADAGWPNGQWADVSVDGNGRIFIADRERGVIRIAVPTGVPVDPGVPGPGPTDPTDPGPVTPNPASDTRLVNLSVRSRAGTGDQTLIMGFVVSSTGTKEVLIRGLGPTLIPLGVATALPDPVLRLYNRSQVKITENDNWGGTAELRNKYIQLGAGALADNSKDAALLINVENGPYTAHVTAADSTSGIALVEAFDAALHQAGRLVNVSARSQVLTGDDILIAGFVLSGNGPKTLLIRGLGPTLATRGVGGALADPQLRIYSRTGVKLYENDDWGGTAALKQVFSQVGAGALASDTSKDAALLLTLEPGVYTAHVSGANNTTGVGLVEIFDVP